MVKISHLPLTAFQFYIPSETPPNPLTNCSVLTLRSAYLFFGRIWCEGHYVSQLASFVSNNGIQATVGLELIQSREYACFDFVPCLHNVRLISSASELHCERGDHPCDPPFKSDRAAWGGLAASNSDWCGIVHRTERMTELIVVPKSEQELV
jgi:hypothetical protein